MPYEHRLLESEGYLLVVGSPPCDLASTLGSMHTAILQLAEEPRRPILVDIRGADFSPTQGEARQLGDLLGDPRLSGARRVAFVVRPGAQFGFARMVSLISGQDGGAVGVFTDLRPAVGWIRDEAPPAWHSIR